MNNAKTLIKVQNDVIQHLDSQILHFAIILKNSN